NKETEKTMTVSITPNKNTSLAVYDSGEYWIESQITTPNGVDNAYTSIVIQNPSEKHALEFFESFSIPIKEIFIISAILAIATAVGLKFRRK
ncbi:MAG TPA: hypothetical protein VLB45_02705, partial [Nitrosopumilaceae archaeon]|nr:hypothetical protein [Nitrosopumilaceae archaeon]